MQENARKRRYIGRVEVLAARVEISALLDAGQPYAWIFEKLVLEGRLTISYRQFCHCLIQYCGVKVRPKKRQKTGSNPSPTSSSQDKKPLIINADLPSFVWNPDKDMESLI